MAKHKKSRNDVLMRHARAVVRRRYSLGSSVSDVGICLAIGLPADSRADSKSIPLNVLRTCVIKRNIPIPMEDPNLRIDGFMLIDD